MEGETEEIDCWGLCCKMICSGQSYMAIPGKEPCVFCSIPLPLFIYCFYIWLSAALALVAICTDRLYRSKTVSLLIPSKKACFYSEKSTPEMTLGLRYLSALC